MKKWCGILFLIFCIVMFPAFGYWVKDIVVWVCNQYDLIVRFWQCVSVHGFGVLRHCPLYLVSITVFLSLLACSGMLIMVRYFRIRRWNRFKIYLHRPYFKWIRKSQSTSAYAFKDDLPSVGNDELGRARFCKYVAEMIVGFPTDKQSAVVALYGDWGEGKTRCCCEIRKQLHKDSHVWVDFNPWTYLKGEDLPYLLFEEVVRAVTKDLKMDFDKHGARVRRGLSDFADDLRFRSFLIATKEHPVFGSMWELFIKGRCCSGKIKSALKEALGSFGKRIIIAIDDLDRMSPEQIYDFLSLVKANADIPNIVYLLPCDKEHVAKGLQKTVGLDNDSIKDGISFLEKIVQYPIYLPVASRPLLHGWFLREFQNLASRFGIDVSKAMRYDLNYDCVLPYMCSPRNVIRFLNVLEMELGRFYRVAGEEKVCLVDLIAVVGLKVFEPGFYQRLYENRQLFYDQFWNQLLSPLFSGDSRTKWTLLKQALFPVCSEDQKRRFKNFLSGHMLIRQVPGGRPVVGDDFEVEFIGDLKKLRAEYRIASPDCFDRYFVGDIGERSDWVNMLEVDKFIAGINDVDSSVAWIDKISLDGRLISFLELAENGIANEDTVRSFVRVMLRAAELPSTKAYVPAGMIFDCTNIYSVYDRFARCTLFSFNNCHMRGPRAREVFMECLKETGSIVVAAHIIGYEMDRRLDPGNDGRYLSDEQLDALIDSFFDNVIGKMEDGSLVDFPDEYTVRRCLMMIAYRKSENGKCTENKYYRRYADAMMPLLRKPDSIFNTLMPYYEESSENAVGFHPIIPSLFLAFSKWSDVLDALRRSSDQRCQSVLRCVEYIVSTDMSEESISVDAQRKHVMKG